jgi:hypothetical protein
MLAGVPACGPVWLSTATSIPVGAGFYKLFHLRQFYVKKLS